MWVDRLTIIADILFVMLLAGICTIIYGSVTGDVNVVFYGGGALVLFLVLLLIAKKFRNR